MKAKHIIPAIGLAMCVMDGVAVAAPVNSLSFNMGSNIGSNMKVKFQNADGSWKTVTDRAGNFGSFSGSAGVTKGATLDGLKLSFAYCIDLFHHVSRNKAYTADASFDGVISDRGEINNAGKVAWLMTNQASTATTLNQQSGLQAAIWKQIYENKFELLDTGAIKTAYDGYMAVLGNNTARVNSVVWIDPHSGKIDSNNPLGKTSNQDIVAVFEDSNNKYSGKMMATPIPSALWLFGSAMVGLVGLGKRKAQKNAVAM